MTTPSNAENNIRLARFAKPDGAWYVNKGGVVTNVFDATFDIANQLEQAAVRVKLKQAHNIDIKKRTRSGRTVWEAVTQGENMRGFEPHEDLSELLYRLVESLNGN